jgi:hypothetical protein
MKLTFILVACATLASAQTAAELKGKKIMEDALAAIGGNRYLAMQDRIESGRAYSFYHEKLSGLSIAKIYTRYLTAAPGKTGDELFVREKESFGKSEDSSVLFLENAGWDITWRGSKELPADRVERYRETTLKNIFYIFRQRMREPGMIFESRGSDVIEFQPVDIVDITDSKDRVVTVSFHQTTKLPVRQVFLRRDPVTKLNDEEVTLYSRYKEVSGVQWPHQIRREHNSEKVYEIFADSVAINKDLTDNVFSVPDGGAKSGKKK